MDLKAKEASELKDSSPTILASTLSVSILQYSAQWKKGLIWNGCMNQVGT